MYSSIKTWLFQESRVSTSIRSACTYENLFDYIINPSLFIALSVGYGVVGARQTQNYISTLFLGEIPTDSTDKRKQFLDQFFIGLTIPFVAIFGTFNAIKLIEFLDKLRIGKNKKYEYWGRELHGKATAILKGGLMGVSFGNVSAFFFSDKKTSAARAMITIAAIIGGAISLPQLLTYFTEGEKNCVDLCLDALLKKYCGEKPGLYSKVKAGAYSIPNALLMIHFALKHVLTLGNTALRFLAITLAAAFGIMLMLDLYGIYSTDNLEKDNDYQKYKAIDAQSSEERLVNNDHASLLGNIQAKWCQLGWKWDHTRSVSASLVPSLQLWADMRNILQYLGVKELTPYMWIFLLLPPAIASFITRWARSLLVFIKPKGEKRALVSQI